MLVLFMIFLPNAYLFLASLHFQITDIVFFFLLFYFSPCRKLFKSIIQGFLPGIALKLFLIFLPTILMLMSKFEGYCSISSLERISASKYYIFLFINVFLGSIITGTAFQQLNAFIHQAANEYVLVSTLFINDPPDNIRVLFSFLTFLHVRIIFGTTNLKSVST